MQHAPPRRRAGQPLHVRLLGEDGDERTGSLETVRGHFGAEPGARGGLCACVAGLVDVRETGSAEGDAGGVVGHC